MSSLITCPNDNVTCTCQLPVKAIGKILLLFGAYVRRGRKNFGENDPPLRINDENAKVQRRELFKDSDALRKKGEEMHIPSPFPNLKSSNLQECYKNNLRHFQT